MGSRSTIILSRYYDHLYEEISKCGDVQEVCWMRRAVEVPRPAAGSLFVNNTTAPVTGLRNILEMDKQKAKILFNLLRSSSNEKVVRGLREIKKRLLTSKDNLGIFRSLGLVPQTLKLIQRPNEDILNGSLSILSGCCADEAVRSEVYNVGGITHLLNVLKCAKSESLQVRACKTIANQAQHKSSCDVLFKLNAIDVVIEMLTKCKEDETKIHAIRNLRMLANNGEHCQKIVMSKGILHICSAGFGSATNPPSSDLLRSTIKAIAHFSRVSHPACVSQIMEGTDNMMTVSKMSASPDLEIYECILRTILNIVQTCFEKTTYKRDYLDVDVIDRLCTARAPKIILTEIQNRRVNSIEEEKLILALCKFCEGPSECSNFAHGTLSEPPTFMGRAWMQLLECGGAAMLVSLLITHRHHEKLRPAILKAILGVEYNYSFKDTVLKHFLAAKLLPQLAEQFDELMAEYRKVRRDSKPGSCVHTLKTDSSDMENEMEENEEKIIEDSDNSKKDDMKRNEVNGEKIQVQRVKGNGDCNVVKKCINLNESVPQVSPTSPEPMIKGSSNSVSRTSQSEVLDPTPSSSSGEELTSHVTAKQLKTHMEIFQQKSLPSNSHARECTKISVDAFGAGSSESYWLNNPRSPGIPDYYNPKSPGSLSCSPRSNHSGSGSSQCSPTWSPAQERGELPQFSPPSGSSLQSNVLNVPPWPIDFVSSSAPTSPYSSPPHSPLIRSPRRSTSPIKFPLDWEYNDEAEIEHSDDDGRFSPSILDAKGHDDHEDNKEETDIFEEENLISTDDDNTQEGGASSIVPNIGERLVDDSFTNNTQEFAKDIDEKLVISPTVGKRSRDSSPSCLTVGTPHGKKVKCESEMSNITEPLEKNTNILSSREVEMDECQLSSGIVSSEKEAGKGALTGADGGKSPFIRLNQIKFRVRKRGLVKRQISYPVGETKNEAYSSVEVVEMGPEEQQVDQRQTCPDRRDSSVCSTSAYSDLTTKEIQSLELLELVVRVIGQVANVKEAINPVCREFVPRIVTYLSNVQVIHKSATRMLVTIARNPLCIQPLLDSLFIPFVGVELGEAGDPESPNGCSQCRILSDGAVAFLDQMVNFFNHVHQYGQCEVSNRLHPARAHSLREGCIMALPHVTRCPKLLHDFMVCHPTLDVIMNILHSEKPPNEASYMYATAAISRLATTLQLDNQYKPVMCTVCLHQGKHTPEEVAEHIRMQQNKDKKLNYSLDSSFFFNNSSESEEIKTKECKWENDKVKDVIFKLDDGSTISANREFLSEKNEVLRGMLMGSFVESGSSYVKMPLTNKAALEMLIHFIYGCRCDVMDSGNMSAYIDLVFISQMYFVKHLHAYAVFKMMASISDGEDILKIFESGVGHIDENLILQALCTVLVRPMKTWKRARWMKELFQSSHSKDIDHNIRMIIHHPLDMNRLVCTCDQSLSLYMVSESVYTKLC
nr:uncharacterized protein LOC123768446 isoform X1 [Procambarus clarkii]